MVNPVTTTPFSRTRLSGILGISPEAKPTVTKRPPQARARNDASAAGPPTGSMTTSAPPPVSSLIRTFRSSVV